MSTGLALGINTLTYTYVYCIYTYIYVCIDIVFININVCKPRGLVRATCAPDEILILFYLGLGFCFSGVAA